MGMVMTVVVGTVGLPLFPVLLIVIVDQLAILLVLLLPFDKSAFQHIHLLLGSQFFRLSLGPDGSSFGSSRVRLPTIEVQLRDISMFLDELGEALGKFVEREVQGPGNMAALRE